MWEVLKPDFHLLMNSFNKVGAAKLNWDLEYKDE